MKLNLLFLFLLGTALQLTSSCCRNTDCSYVAKSFYINLDTVRNWGSFPNKVYLADSASGSIIDSTHTWYPSGEVPLRHYIHLPFQHPAKGSLLIVKANHQPLADTLFGFGYEEVNTTCRSCGLHKDLESVERIKNIRYRYRGEQFTNTSGIDLKP